MWQTAGMTRIRLLIRACVREKEKRGTGRVTAILVCRKRSKFEEASGRKRNSQDDTLPRSKINTETGSAETPEHKACNVHLLVGNVQRRPMMYHYLPLIPDDYRRPTRRRMPLLDPWGSLSN